jgi:hypothetical protein
MFYNILFFLPKLLYIQKKVLHLHTQLKERNNMKKKFNVEDFGDSSFEQVENMKFTEEEKLILEYAFSLEEFSDEDYFNLAFYFAENNGLN